jgi:23S rRNA pseudouridine1911/1915/1917 synthase
MLERARERIETMPGPEASEYVEIPFTVEPNYAGWRLDHYLCAKMRRLSRTRVQRIIRRGLVGDRPLKPSTRVMPGLSFRLRRRALDEPETPGDVRELHVDDSILVVDKPAGLPVHPTARYHAGTLVAVLRRKYGAGFRADPAHRLDRETSGLIVCGRTLQSSRKLMRAFLDGAVHKEYLAIVEGWPPDALFEVEAPIAEGTAAIRIAVRIDLMLGKPARTRFRVVRRFERDGERFALVRAFPETGRQHQIRIHLREAGFPIVGDKMYGPDQGYFDRFSRKCLEPEAWERLRLARHALHAAHLRFPHPEGGREVSFDAPLPMDLAAFLREDAGSMAT